MCKKQFKTKGIRDTGSKEEEADTVYLLAKALPHALVSDQNDEFKKLLAETGAKEIAAFAQAVGQQAKEIDGKVCAKKKVNAVAGGDPTPLTEHGRWSCIDYNNGKDGTTADNRYAKDPHSDKTFSWRMSNPVLAEKRSKDVTTGSGAAAKTNGGWPGTAAGEYDTAHAVAGELSGKLSSTEKAKVAGLLSKTISGAEVVEIRAVSTTSVMLNACYDL